MTTLIELLGHLGRLVWEPVWVPLLAWTVLALPVWAVLSRTDRLHPLAAYRLSQVVLASLPLGMLVAALPDLWPHPTAGAAASLRSVVIVPTFDMSTSASTAEGAGWQWAHVCGLLTLAAAGAALMQLVRLTLDLWATVQIRSQVHGSSLSSIQARARRVARRLGTTRTFQVCLSSDAQVPMTLSGLRPTILLPTELACQPDALRMTLIHECVHLRRYDDLAHLVERAITALFAVHPLVHQLHSHIAEAREQACDAAVLDDDTTAAARYARLLLTFADGNPRPAPNTLSLSESPSALTTRLRAMQSTVSRWLSSPRSLGGPLLALGLFLTVGVTACSDSVAPGTTSDPSASPEPTSKKSVLGKVRSVVDTPPDCGGLQALAKELQYPEGAQEADIEGRVVVDFIVDKNGDVLDPTVAKGVDARLDEAALAAVNSLNCEPGTHKGQPKRVKMSLPVTFKLEDRSTPASDGGSDDADLSGDTPELDSGGRLFEKAETQVVRVLMNVDGDILLGDKPVKIDNLADAVQQRITKDTAPAALLYADGAPTDRVAAAEARLRALDLQNVYVKKVE